jgi:thiol-disulfide isomerase/thioredoxin
MKTPLKILTVALLTVAVAAVVVVKNRPGAGAMKDAAPVAPGQEAKLPRLVDLGADKCIPCKAMAPILAELKRDYGDRFITEFVDVWKNPDAGKLYGIEVIPTQIFFDVGGKELFRHVGFFSKEDILAKWKELGVSAPGQ